MNRPTPQDVDTDGYFFNVCEGMRHGCEAETTVRLFCLTAKDHDRWELTQEELDARDSNGKFYWNGTIDAGFFVRDEANDVYRPTANCFGRLLQVGRITLIA